MKKALITGVAGQDGSYLAEYLLSLGYQVSGLIRTNPTYSRNLRNCCKQVNFLYGDMRDATSIETAIRKSDPDEIYNLAGQVFVPTSWSRPEETFDVNTGGLARILSAVERIKPSCRVYQASTSEMFGNVNGKTKLNETSRMEPCSPYGASKLAAHHLIRIYREKGLFCVSGILFNHESPRRGTEMVTRKITQAVARWSMGDRFVLKLGTLTAERDWGFAGDYVRAMHKMLQREEPTDYVVGTGVRHSILDALTVASDYVGIDFAEEKLVEIGDKAFVRQNEQICLQADSTKAAALLGWSPRTSFVELIQLMVNHDQNELREREQEVMAGAYSV